MGTPRSGGTAGKPAGTPAEGDLLRRFTLRIAVPAALVFAFTSVLIVVLLGGMADEINRLDAARGREAVGAATSGLLEGLTASVADEATWTEAFANTYVEFSPAWLDATWGTTARIGDAYDLVLVTDPAGNILFGENREGPVDGTLADIVSGGAEMVADLVQAAAIGGADVARAHFVTIGGAVAAIAGEVIHGTGGQVANSPSEQKVLWLGHAIDARVLSDIAQRFQLPPLSLSDVVPDGNESVQLADAAGAPIGSIVWEPARPGNAAALHAVGTAVFAMTLAGLLTGFGLLAFRQSVKRRVGADAREWRSLRVDDATGLPTEFGLIESVDRRLASARSPRNAGVAAVSIDNFREIASYYGEAAAEEMISAFMSVLRGRLGDGWTCARVACDRLALVAIGPEPGGPLADAFAVAALETAALPLSVGTSSYKPRISVGVTDAGIARGGLPALLGQAEAALLRARQTGGGHSVRYDTSIEEARRQRIELQADMRRGFDNGEFDLVYQPVFDFGTQAMAGVEALLRWPRRKAGVVPPDVFVPVAEASGLIEDLDMFVIERAIRDIGPFPDFKVSVNLSSAQRRNPRLIEQVRRVLGATGFPASRLQIELTEGFLLDNVERAIGVIAELKALGVTLAFDNFGAGVASTGFLRQFGFDRLKLDRSMVSDVDTNPARMTRLKAKLELAATFGLDVTAGGVERREEAAALTSLGRLECQGYFFAKPMPLDAFRRLLSGETEPVAPALPTRKRERPRRAG